MSIQVFDGSGYLQIPGTPGPQSFAHVGPTAPDNPEVGQMWVDDSAPLIDQWDDDWTYPVLTGGWSVFEQSNWGPTRYRKAAGNLVIVEGLVAGGTVGDMNSPVFTLPAGYRPEGALTFAGVAYTQIVARLRVNEYGDGAIVVWQGSSTWTGLHMTFIAGA